MNTETRRVYAFIGVGLLTAAGVGVGVWRAGEPSTPSASDTATVTAEVSTIADSADAPLVTPAPESPDVTGEVLAQTPTTTRVDDPFLAPHAIVQAVPSTIAPTTVYRPENVRPTAQAGDGPEATQPAEPTALAQPTGPTGTPEATQPTDAPATTAPEVPDETAQPTTETQQPQQQPDGATEPAEPTAGATAEPSSEPTAQTETAETAESAENAETASPVATDRDVTEQAGQDTRPEPTETTETAVPAEPAGPAGEPAAPEIEPAAATQERPGWWIFGRWFPASS